MVGMAIDYSDGAVEGQIRDLILEANDLRSTTQVASEYYGSWPIRYHLSAERANLFRHLNFEGLDVLELGAGMGAVSRYLAESAQSLTVVEGTQSRFDALSARLRDLENWKGVVANIQDYQTEERFDVVCLVGVLEYSELYIQAPDGVSPFDWLLQHATSLLRPGGVVAVAIENLHGIKYWGGAPEDHTGRMFDGICGYGLGKSPRTFSRRDLTAMLARQGLEVVDQYYPWPDYKMPVAVLSHPLVEVAPTVATEIAGEAIHRDAQEPRFLYPVALALEGVTQQGWQGDFANSFLFLGCADAESPIRQTLLQKTLQGELAWIYSLGRRVPLRTTLFSDAEIGLGSRKETLEEDAPNPSSNSIHWENPGVEPLIDLPRLSTLLTKAAYFGDIATFDALMSSFLVWVVRSKATEDGISGAAFDATVSNAFPRPGGFQLFDQEWRLPSTIRPSWFVLRNVREARRAYRTFSNPPHGTLAEWYAFLCSRHGIKADLEHDLADEARVQATVAAGMTAEKALEILRKDLFNDELHLHPRDPELEVRLRAGQSTIVRNNIHLEREIEALRLENHHLRAELTRKAIRIALLLDRGVRRIPGVHGALRKVAAFVRRRATPKE